MVLQNEEKRGILVLVTYIVQVAVFMFHWKFVVEMSADVSIFPIFLPLAWYL